MKQKGNFGRLSSNEEEVNEHSFCFYNGDYQSCPHYNFTGMCMALDKPCYMEESNHKD